MDRRDQQAITELFGKLAEVERRSPPRDAEADNFIHDQMNRQPGAGYYMAQTIIVQEQALAAAEARIRELEEEASRASSGGIFGALFGGGRRPPMRDHQLDRRTNEPHFDDPRYGRRSAGTGGGFLAGAAQTAMGVAGGVLLGNAIAGMFGNDAQASTDASSGADAGHDTDDTGFFGGEGGWGNDDGGDFGGDDF